MCVASYLVWMLSVGVHSVCIETNQLVWMISMAVIKSIVVVTISRHLLHTSEEPDGCALVDAASYGHGGGVGGASSML